MIKKELKEVKKFHFYCRVCRWKFQAKSLPKLCPYCGRTATCEEDTSKGAQDIIDEVDAMQKQADRLDFSRLSK